MLLQVDHNFHLANMFKIVLVDINHKFHMHCIVGDFKYVLVEKNDKFHLYDNQNKLSILLPFAPYSNRVEYEHIQYIICVFLNSWMSFFVIINILSSSSSFKNVASLSLKTI
jgi:hypothetical protein